MTSVKELLQPCLIAASMPKTLTIYNNSVNKSRITESSIFPIIVTESDSSQPKSQRAANGTYLSTLFSGDAPQVKYPIINKSHVPQDSQIFANVPDAKPRAGNPRRHEETNKKLFGHYSNPPPAPKLTPEMQKKLNITHEKLFGVTKVVANRRRRYDTDTGKAIWGIPEPRKIVRLKENTREHIFGDGKETKQSVPLKPHIKAKIQELLQDKTEGDVSQQKPSKKPMPPEDSHNKLFGAATSPVAPNQEEKGKSYIRVFGDPPCYPAGDSEDKSSISEQVSSADKSSRIIKPSKKLQTQKTEGSYDTLFGKPPVSKIRRDRDGSYSRVLGGAAEATRQQTVYDLAKSRPGTTDTEIINSKPVEMAEKPETSPQGRKHWDLPAEGSQQAVVLRDMRVEDSRGASGVQTEVHAGVQTEVHAEGDNTADRKSVV